MTLSMAELEELRAECFADDMSIPSEATLWSRERATLYFETAGASEKPGYKPTTTAAWAATTVHKAPVPAAALGPSYLPTPTLSGDGDGRALCAPLNYEVVHTFVRVRKEPELRGQELGLQKKGDILSIDAIHADWVRLEEEPAAVTGGERAVGGSNASLAGGWMLTDGTTLSTPGMKLGILLRPHITPVANDTFWQITRPGGCVGYQSPGGDARGEPAQQHEELAQGSSVHVEAECGLWARVKLAGGAKELWLPMDAFFAG
jgi:hypothetical protein